MNWIFVCLSPQIPIQSPGVAGFGEGLLSRWLWFREVISMCLGPVGFVSFTEDTWGVFTEEGQCEGTARRPHLQTRRRAIIGIQPASISVLDFQLPELWWGKDFLGFSFLVNGILLRQLKLCKPQILPSTLWYCSHMSMTLPHWCIASWGSCSYWFTAASFWEGAETDLVTVTLRLAALGHTVQIFYSKVPGSCCEGVFRRD